MGWPDSGMLWREDAKPAQKQYADVAKAISQFEPVVMMANPEVTLQCLPSLVPTFPFLYCFEFQSFELEVYAESYPETLHQHVAFGMVTCYVWLCCSKALLHQQTTTKAQQIQMTALHRPCIVSIGRHYTQVLHAC